MRFFNTAGPCRPDRHYMLPAAARLPEARRHIDREQYFVVHAPRQSGKTTTLQALAGELTAEDRYAAIWFSCEAAAPASEEHAPAVLLRRIAEAARRTGLPAELRPPDPWPEAPPGLELWAGLGAWAERCPKPLVLFFDEIDSLEDASLVSVLRQLRDGYTARPAPFPHSVVLCGMRDVKDYRAMGRGGRRSLGTASPFNIKVDSMRLGDFTEDEVGALYDQHTTETGQPFTKEAVEQAYEYTRGQPWLVNALAAEIVDEMDVPASEPITGAHVDQARERLVLARATHLDSLAARLAEPRVQHVIEPMIAGELDVADATFDEDVNYLQDLGLLAQGRFVEIANPIYREVIVRVLGAQAERRIPADPRSFVMDDGRLDFRKLLEQVAAFWARNAEVLVKGGVYHEVAPQLVIMAFIHRIVNGGGVIDREYGLGYRRVDLVVRWPYRDAQDRLVWQEEGMELKVWHEGQSSDPTPEGLQQLDGYLDRLRLDTGTLVVFDRRPTAPPLPDRIAFTTEQTPSGRPVTLLRA